MQTMRKIIAITTKNEPLSPASSASIYDGNQDQLRAIYQDCCDDLKTAR